MQRTSHIVTGVILTVTLLISPPFYFLSKGVGWFACALYYGFVEGWCRAKRLYD